MHEGQRGFCFVRQNVGGEMVLTTYGKSSGFCVDPIEKKPLNHFLPGTPVLSFGTAGCNLGCKFCQNWSISKAKEIEKLSDNAGPEEIARAAKSAGCRSVAFTYNDPVIWAEYAIDTAHACHDVGLKTVAVTAGYITPAARKDFYDVMDAANVDLKAFTEAFYQHLTLSRLEPVLDTLRWLKHETNVWFEITNLMIPGENDSADETARMCDWIVQNLGTDVPVHFTAFHPDFRMRDRPPTPKETLIRAREQALQAGIRYPYVGNVHDVAGQSTYCPGCGQMLIERDWYELGAYRLRGNLCDKCSTPIAGVFDQSPGNWGRARVPLRIEAPRTPPPLVPAQPVTAQPAPSGSVPAASIRPAVMSQPESPPAAPAAHDFCVSMVSVSAGGVNVSGPVMMPPIPGLTMPAAPPPRPAPVAPPPVLPQAAPIQTRSDFTEDEGFLIAEFARDVVDSTLHRTPAPTLPPDLAAAPVYGIFVTLRRAGLRACRGRFGDVVPLAEAVAGAARDAATLDPRFPSIMFDEFPYLTVDVSVMFDPQPIAARGEERRKSVIVGRHGVVIAHPRGRGLLLPQVADEAGWNSRQFLEALSGKAGLPGDAWLDDASQLMTFRAQVFETRPTMQELDAQELPGPALDRLLEVADDVFQGKPMSATDLPECLTKTYSRNSTIGLCLHTNTGRATVTMGSQRSLAECASAAGRSLRDSLSAEARAYENVQRVSLLWQPVTLTPRDYPDRHRQLRGSALVAKYRGRWGVHIARPDDTVDPVANALASINSSIPHWSQPGTDVEMLAYTVRQHARVTVPVSDRTREPARAGQFYPAAPAEMQESVTKILGESTGPRATYRALMLPHAGWAFCGTPIGKTLAGVAVPRTVIVVGPKHTAQGANWSVSSADVWNYPGGSVPVDAAIRTRLLELVPALQCDAEAHRQEHSVESLLPFLARLNPELRIVPVVLGRGNFNEIEKLAKGLAAVCAEQVDSERTEPPLLVISSDMNHFAPEAENRRLDFLAIDAMCTGDPRRLYSVVRENEISMCGVLPAVAVMRALHEQGADVRPELVHYTNSGEVTGNCDRVVGYAGMRIL